MGDVTFATNDPTATPTPSLSRAERAVLPPSGLLKLDDDRRRVLEAFLHDFCEQHDQRAGVGGERLRAWRSFLAGRNPDPSPRAGMSNISVPFMMWANTAVRQRIVRGVNGQRTVVQLSPAGGNEDADAKVVAALNKLSTFIDTAYRNERDLNGAETIRALTATMTSAGTGAGAVVITPARVVNVPSSDGKTTTLRTVRRASVKWHAIRHDDIIYEDGYGVDFDRMIACGYYVPKSWAEIGSWVAQGHYYPDVADRIRGHYTRDSTKVATIDPPEVLAPHRVAALYLDWDINDDGYVEPLVVDWHRDAQVLMRVAWSSFDDGARPLFAAQFDLPSRDGDYQGQGVCEKLEDPQRETNAVHNIGIEAGKRAILPITITRQGTPIASFLGATGVVTPGENFTTGDIEKDFRVEMLGDPKSIEGAIVMESNTRGYVARLLGRDESSLGNLESAKRVPGGLGGAIMQESRVPIEDALSSVATAMTRAFYLTISAWQRVVPVAQLRAALDDETIATLTSLVFTRDGSDIRDRLQVVVRAQDVAATEQAKQQSLLALNNFLMGYYDRVAATLQLLFARDPASGQPLVPTEAAPIVIRLVEKLQNAVELLLRTVDEVDDPRRVLLAMDEIKSQYDAFYTAATGGVAATSSGGGGGNGAVSATNGDGVAVDLGGGVA